MPGPQDHATEQERGPDRARPPETDSPRGAHAPPADLRARLERLPAGHPSSPYRDDGSRKPPPLDLTKLELPLPRESGPAGPTPDATATEEEGERRLADAVEPLTDAEHAAQARQARDHLSRAGADGLATILRDTVEPDHEIWSEQREALHDAIIDDLYARAAGVPCEHRAITAGGLPGAGKTTVLERHAGIDRSQFLTIDPDQIKEELARRGMTPPIEYLSPMETSSLIHEESSHIATRLAYRAHAEGKNVIWDTTMSSAATTERRIADLRGAGYTQIEGIFVDVSIETSVARTDLRHRTGHDEYRAGHGYGGRLTPPEVIREKADPVWGSVNRRVFEEVKHLFDRWSIYDNSPDGHPPVLMDSSVQERIARWPMR